MIRYYGRLAPDSTAGAAGQFAIALRPARIAAEYEISSWRLRPGLSPTVAVSFAPADTREGATGSDAPAPCAPSGFVPRVTSAVAFFVESGLATVAAGLASQPARAIMLAAKNNGSHLGITPCVQACAMLRMLSDTDPGAPGRYEGDRRGRRVLAAKGINCQDAGSPLC